jgi:hypothetical protein
MADETKMQPVIETANIWSGQWESTYVSGSTLT